MPPQSSPLLDQYNQDGIITPALQRALDIARQKLPQWQLPAPISTDSTAPRLMPPGAPVPPITRMTPATTTGPAPTPATPMPQITDPDVVAHQAERDRLIRTGSGISQVQNHVARGLLRAADVIGSAFAPRITAGIPGTELHHNYLVKQAEGAVDKDVARAKENAQTTETEQRAANEGLAAPGQRAHIEAETRNLNAEANAREHPPAKEPTNLLGWYRQAYPDKKPEDYAKFEQENKAATEKGGTIHQLEDGSLIMAHPDGTATPVTVNGQPVKGKTTEKEPNQYADFKTDYLKKHPNADAAEIQQAFARARQKPEEHGVTVIGPDGKVLRLEPGQTAPAGFTTPQQGGAANAAEAKAFKGANDAVKYGQDYIKSGQFSGPKDEALLEAFFEVAKPSSGFRMSQPQINMLMNARSWMESAEGIAYHAKTGTWFAPDQRQKIVDAMEARAASKAGGGRGNAPATIRARDPQGKLHEAPAGTPLPAGWKAEK